ncbi:MAG TPA: molybdate ABC transporter substrate-binding protein [Pirellulales bacterium]|jgi:molybdate transport system substrate-binding protein|nr:molybdate ABC transporter substrate-binding protein [Pirellulales bacterium]
MRRLKITLAILVAVLLGGCSQQPSAPGVGKPELIVSAAASTKEVMEALASQFQSEFRTEVKVNTGPSSGLAAQIEAGAPADLFLSASQQWADDVQKANLADATVRLLTNRLVMVVPKGNPAGVQQPQDLLLAQVKKIALAGEKVPAGMYADQALTKLDLLKKLTDDGKIVRGQDVRSALSYVERGEAEAGIVYSTDVGTAPGTTQIYEFDPKLHDEIVYALVLLKHGGANPAAKQLFDFLQSSKADEVYAKFGFSRLHEAAAQP